GDEPVGVAADVDVVDATRQPAAHGPFCTVTFEVPNGIKTPHNSGVSQTTLWPPRLIVILLAPTMSGAAQSADSVVLAVIVPQAEIACADPTCTAPAHAATARLSRRSFRTW